MSHAKLHPLGVRDGQYFSHIVILESHDNYHKHPQLSKYREGNNIVNIAGIANFHPGSFANDVHR